LYVCNQRLFDKWRDVDRDSEDVRAVQSPAVYAIALEAVDEDEEIKDSDEWRGEWTSTYKRRISLGPSSHTYHSDDNYTPSSYAASPPTTALSNTTDPSSSSDSGQYLMAAANDTSHPTSRPPSQHHGREAKHVREEETADAAALHRKQDSGYAEYVDGEMEKERSSGRGAVEEMGKSTKEISLRSVSDVMNRGRPNKGFRQARKTSGVCIL
jgi:hypothetical protein